MIKPNKIQEWIEEIETRPMVAPFIVRTLSARVIELDQINEELRTENLSLRSGKKIEEYERRIAELEYQIELLKRQVKNGQPLTPSAQALLLVYDADGRLAARAFTPTSLVHNHVLSTIQNFSAPHRDDIHLLAVGTHEELLYLFDSGRIETGKAADIVSAPDGAMDWQNPRQISMRSGEKLISILPITEAPLKDGCVQVSRKGLARLIPKDYFQSFLRENSIGKGVRSSADVLLNLVICDRSDVCVLVSHSGYISAAPAQQLSITFEEAIRLGMQDYLVSAFTIQPDQDLVFVLESGEIFLQDNPWQQTEDADGAKRRLLLGGSRAGGVQIIGAGAAGSAGWVITLNTEGEIKMENLYQIRTRKQKKEAKTQKAGQTLAFSLWQEQPNPADQE